MAKAPVKGRRTCQTAVPQLASNSLLVQRAFLLLDKKFKSFFATEPDSQAMAKSLTQKRRAFRSKKRKIRFQISPSVQDSESLTLRYFFLFITALCDVALGRHKSTLNKESFLIL